MFKMPGKTYAGPLSILTDAQISLRNELAADVEKLAGQIGQKNIFNYHNLAAAADFIESSLTDAGYNVHRQDFSVEGKVCCNLEAEITGTKHPDRIIIIGAHYDSVLGSPGANDNCSAVAAALALARRFTGQKTAQTLRFVSFANEEPPFFQTDRMGSLIYAKSCRERGESIVAMLCLETIGYYSDQPDSQRYPFPFGLMYPSTGDFLGFVGNLSSRKLLHRVVASFRRNCSFPSQAGCLPEFVPGINWSDHWSFWQQGYPAVMLTDTAPFRYPYYHSPEDTPDKIDYDRLAIVTTGLHAVITDITTQAEDI
jgi:Zn-dependent M28 family amino/carboxypeptidase